MFDDVQCSNVVNAVVEIIRYLAVRMLPSAAGSSSSLFASTVVEEAVLVLSGRWHSASRVRYVPYV